MEGRLLALTAAFLFSLGPVILKIGLRKGSTDLAVLVSMVIGLPLMLIAAPFLGGMKLADLTTGTIILFAVGGMLGPLLGRIFLYNGIDRLGSSRAFTIQNTGPLITTIAAIIILAEPVTFWRWFAIIIIVIGLALVGKRSSAVPGPLRMSGVIFAFLAAISFGIRPVIYKIGFQEQPDPMTASVVGAAAALLGVLVYLFTTGKLQSLQVDRRSLTLFAIVGVVHNLGFLTVNYAFNAGDVTQVYPITSTAPLLAFGMSYFILSNVEQLAAWDLVGTLAVVIGVGMLFR